MGESGGLKRKDAGSCSLPAPAVRPTTAIHSGTSNCRSPRRLKLYASRNAPCEGVQYGHRHFKPMDVSLPCLEVNPGDRIRVVVNSQDQDVETSSNKSHFVTAPPGRHDYEWILPSKCPTRRLLLRIIRRKSTQNLRDRQAFGQKIAPPPRENRPKRRKLRAKAPTKSADAADCNRQLRQNPLELTTAIDSFNKTHWS